MTSSAIAPVGAGERLHTLDILRGCALFGMILVHFHQKMRLEASGLENLIGWGVWVLVEQKAWGTFAFLFGVGFAVLLRRLEMRNAPVAVVYARRLFTLALFGVIADVGFGFQILFAYAFWGVALLLVRKWSTRNLLILAALSACAGPLLAEAIALYQSWQGIAPAPAANAELLRVAAEAAQQDSYLHLLAARWALFVSRLPHTWRGFIPDTNLALFLVGLLAVRHGVLDQPKQHVRLIVGWMSFGLVSWAVSWLVLYRLPDFAAANIEWPIKYGFGLVQDQWLCFTYIGALVLLLAYRTEWIRRLSVFGQAGRMALTNYMLQVAVLDALASGYGLQLKLRPFVYVIAAVLLFGVEATFSSVWLARYRFGPLEWIWRMLTYGSVVPLRRESGTVVEVAV